MNGKEELILSCINIPEGLPKENINDLEELIDLVKNFKVSSKNIIWAYFIEINHSVNIEYYQNLDDLKNELPDYMTYKLKPTGKWEIKK